jgi:sugar phosphate isomerase/epimerase
MGTRERGTLHSNRLPVEGRGEFVSSALDVPLGIQLYTLREEADRDFPAVLARLRAIGFRGVEVAAFHGLSARELRARLDDNGLDAPSLHGNPVGTETSRVLDDAEALGVEAVVIPAAAPDRFESAAAIDALADEITAANESATARGFALGYHNHFWEWQTLSGESTAELGWDRLWARLPAPVFAEVDVYWAQVAGQDPVTVLRALGDRARFLHLKDGPADTPAAAMVAAGDGAVDLAAALNAAAAARWYFVELDRCDSDMFEAVERSHRYLQTLAG